MNESRKVVPAIALERGVRVRVVCTERCFDFMEPGTTHFLATYRAGPAGPGDVFSLTLDDGRDVVINGNAAAFVGIVPTLSQPRTGDLPF
jgi:hypothetical protein